MMYLHVWWHLCFLLDYTGEEENIVMARCKTAVSPVHQHWRYQSLAPSHQYVYRTHTQLTSTWSSSVTQNIVSINEHGLFNTIKSQYNTVHISFTKHVQCKTAVTPVCPRCLKHLRKSFLTLQLSNGVSCISSKVSLTHCWLDWICLTTTHVFRDILAVLILWPSDTYNIDLG